MYTRTRSCLLILLVHLATDKILTTSLLGTYSSSYHLACVLGAVVCGVDELYCIVLNCYTDRCFNGFVIFSKSKHFFKVM